MATESNTAIRKLNKPSTIEGVYSTNDSISESNRTSNPSTIVGTDSTIASIIDVITVVAASQIADAPPAITSQNLIMPTPICSIKYGIKPIILDTIKTKAEATAAPEVAKAVKPIENIKTPAPIAATATPNITIAIDNFRIVPINGFNKSPAAPIIMKAPAKAVKPLPISSQDIVAINFNADANIINAGAIINKATAPGIAFLIIAIAPAIINKEPPSATNPSATSSHDIVAINFNADANITIAGAIIIIATAPGNAFFISRIAMTKIPKEPANVTRLLPISSQDIVAMILRATPKIIIDVARDKIPKDLRAMSFGNKFAAATNAPKPTTAPINPLANSPQLKDPSIFIAIENISNAVANFLIAFAALLTFPLGKRFTAPTNAPKPTTIAINPLANSLQLRDDTIFIAAANIKTALDIVTIARDTFCIPSNFSPSDIFPNINIAPKSSVNKAVIAVSATVNFSESTKDNAINAIANIPIADAIVNKVFAFIDCVNALKVSLTPPKISLILFMNPLALSNTPLADFINLAINTPIAAMIPPFTTSNNAS